MPRIFPNARWVLGLFLCLYSTALCQADGLIIIRTPPERQVPGHFAFTPLEVTYHHVVVEIHDQIATTSVDQEFYNPNPQDLEGTYVFPLPAGSHIDKFSMDIDGKMMDAELLGADKARSLYEEIVRKYKDPALLEYMGRDAFKVRIYPIPANSRKKVKLTYTQLLKSDGPLVEYTYPMNTEKFSAKPLENVSVKVSIDSKDPIKSIYSPTHSIDIHRDGDKRAVVGWEARDVRPDADFKVIYSCSKQPVGVDLLTYRQGEDGYFLLLASPGLEAPKGTVQKKDVCFVLDTSGSMNGEKIEQARKALTFCLNSLDDTDRFEVIHFATECEPLFSELRPASKENVARALSFVKDLRASGGTNIQDALHQALAVKHDADRPYEVVFLTDGEPTVGETSEDALVAQAAKESGGNARVFCFGLGHDVNTHLLDRIAADTHAFSTYVAPEEDIEVKISTFYTKIKEPVLSNVQLAFTGDAIHVSQLYPNPMPDLFKGEVLVAFGRYTGSGASAVKVTGTIAGDRQTFVTDVRFADQDATNAYIPRLWAIRRVGYLLDEIRMHGESAELKDEVTRLARAHGIVTPYTAYLILEDERRRNVPLSMQSMREFGSDDRVVEHARGLVAQNGSEALDASTRTGARAVDGAKDVAALARNDSLDSYRNAEQNASLAKAAPASPAPAAGTTTLSGANTFTGATTVNGGTVQADAPANGYRVARNYVDQARVINGRAFYQNGSIWTDATAQTRHDLKQQQIPFNSDAYFDLLAHHPEVAEWLALGTEVDVVIDGTLYSVR